MPITLTTQQLNYNGGNQYVTIDAISPPIEAGQYMPIDAGIEHANIGDIVRISAVDAQGHPIAYEPSPVFHTLTVHVTDTNDNYISGVSVKIRHNTEDGEIYVADTTTNQPLSFSLPTGFPYFIDVSNPNTLGNYYSVLITEGYGIVQNTNITVYVTYKSVSDIRTAQEIQEALDNNVDLTDLVGGSITCNWRNTELEWDVVDYTDGTVTLMTHYAIPGPAYNYEDMLLYCTSRLEAGKYYFTTSNNNNKANLFTLTKAIPFSGQLRINNTTDTFTTYISQDDVVLIEEGTITQVDLNDNALSDATNLGHAGENNLNDYSRARFGSNNYGESIVYKWLNSAYDIPITFYPTTKFQHEIQLSSSTFYKGFLNGLDENFINILDNVTWKCNANNVYECPTSLNGICSAKNTLYTVTGKVGLASLKEVFGTYDGLDDTSTVFDLYADATDVDRIKYRLEAPSVAEDWILRTPVSNSSYQIYHVSNDGSTNWYNFTTSSMRYAPVVKISKTVII